MTANDCTPGDGHESDGSVDDQQSGPSFEKWARKEMATRIDIQATLPAEHARDVAEDVRDGDPVSPTDVKAVRREAQELLRLVDGVLLSSEGSEDADREQLAGNVLEAGSDVEQAARHLDSVVLNEETVEPRDIQMVRGYVEQLEEAVDDVAHQLQN